MMRLWNSLTIITILALISMLAIVGMLVVEGIWDWVLLFFAIAPLAVGGWRVWVVNQRRG